MVKPGAYVLMNIIVALLIVFGGVLLLIGIKYNEQLVRRIVDCPERTRMAPTVKQPRVNQYKTATGQAIARVLANLRMSISSRNVSLTSH